MNHQGCLQVGENLMGVVSKLNSPMAAMVLLILAVAFAALTLAASISGALTSAAVSAAGFIGIIFILFMIRVVGGQS